MNNQLRRVADCEGACERCVRPVTGVGYRTESGTVYHLSCGEREAGEGRALLQNARPTGQRGLALGAA